MLKRNVHAFTAPLLHCENIRAGATRIAHVRRRPSAVLRLLLMTGSLLALTTVAHAAKPVPLPKGHVISGIASFYGAESGNKTASGERFDPERLTAAHLTLPFGTRLKVTEPQSGRSVEVVINDRGPYIKGRVLDLSVAAARAIGMIDRGISHVIAEVL
jgi:rare lipoprotein A (peptidoglycan hydrolase)